MLYKILFVIAIIITILILKFGHIHSEIDNKLNIKSRMIIFDMPMINLHKIRFKRFALYLIRSLEKKSCFHVSGRKYEKSIDDNYKCFSIYFKRTRVTFIVEKGE
jgi:hypothetical protein